MMKNIGLLYAFLGGAVVGCATALLFAPEKGSDLRARIVAMLNKKGVKISDAEIDQLVAELSGSIE
ncbi:MAG: YtxH domain-containing protein [Muribaculaceae bacterium]|jgi:gas vesicle protein|nr:YtxH domain-containing protein [Muribaculaceae bacterium]